METLRVLKTQGLVPRRTLRAVLFANEENGLRGARAYAEQHADELPRHVAAMEADAGGERPLGLAVEAGPGGLERMERVARLFPLLDAPRIIEREAGADIGRLAAGRVPRLGLMQEDTHYFHWHHSRADTFDKIDPRALAVSAAFFATVAYVLAEDADTLPRPAPPAKPEP
jgi:Zn-dependent M28 family amino/carboxypeptidase